MTETSINALLAEMEKRPEWTRRHAALGELATTLARALDTGAPNPAASARELRAIIDTLESEMSTAAPSKVDALADRRRLRRAGS